MNDSNEVNAKQTADKACGDTCGPAEPNPSMRSKAEQKVGYHRAQAEKHDRAAAFFRENPAFDEFIQLVRSGAIQF